MNLERRDEILEGALDLDPGELEDFLSQQCGPDAGLRAEVERLIGMRGRMQTNFLDGAAAEWTSPTLSPGQSLGRYIIERVIGVGGMSTVYLAKDEGIGRRVAIKVLTSGDIQPSGNTPYTAEVRMLGSIRHPNVVQIFDFGYLHGVPYIVMEYLEGEDLACTIASGKCGDFKWKLAVARQLASALSHVHEAGIIHRDVKPANVFVAPDGAVKLMDFGISRFDNTAVTKSSAFLGTPEYLPPEHVKGQRATNRSDIYSYGILLFELFTGEKAFSGNTAEVLYRVVHEDVPLDALRERRIPRSLDMLIRAAIQKDPMNRPADFAQLSKILASVTDQPQIDRSSGFRFGYKAGAAAVLVFCVLGALSWRLAYPVRQSPNLKNSGSSTSVKKADISPPATADRSRESEPKVEAPVSQTPASRPSKGVPIGTERPALRSLPRSLVFIPTRPEHATDPGHLTEDQGLSMQLPSRALPQTKLELPHVAIPDRLAVTPQSNSGEVTPPAQPSSVPDAQSALAAAKHDVLLVLDRYAQAYRDKDIEGMTALFPSLTDLDRRKLASAFSVARSVDLMLAPKNEPQIEMRADGVARVGDCTLQPVDYDVAYFRTRAEAASRRVCFSSPTLSKRLAHTLSTVQLITFDEQITNYQCLQRYFAQAYSLSLQLQRVARSSLFRLQAAN